MRVLHVISSLKRAAGGPTSALLGLAAAQAKLGADVSVLSAWNDSEASVAPELKEAGVTLIPFEAGTRPSLRHVTATMNVYKAVSCADVVHIHGLWQFLPTLAATVAYQSRVPYVIRTCGMLDRWSLAQKQVVKKTHLALLTRPLLNRAAYIHATTEQEAIEVGQLGLRPEIRIEANGVDEDAFVETNSNDTLMSQLGSENRIVLFLGRVRAQKGIDILIEAMHQIRSERAVLAVVGPLTDEYSRIVRHRVKEQGMSNRVHFFEAQYGAARFPVYSSADIFALPSEHENFGMTVAEAMSRGVPVVVSPEVALSKLILKSDAGIVASRTPAEFAEAIDRLLMDAAVRSRMGQNGRNVAEVCFRWSAIGERWLEAYQCILTTRCGVQES